MLRQEQLLENPQVKWIPNLPEASPAILVLPRETLQTVLPEAPDSSLVQPVWKPSLEWALTQERSTLVLSGTSDWQLK